MTPGVCFLVLAHILHVCQFLAHLRDQLGGQQGFLYMKDEGSPSPTDQTFNHPYPNQEKFPQLTNLQIFILPSKGSSSH